MKNSINKKIDDVFKEVGEFGPYQLLVFILVGFTAFIPAIVGYSYSFYAAVPNHRCQIPGLNNDTYEIANDYHLHLVEKYIPPPKDKSFKDDYDKCQYRDYSQPSSEANFTLVKCNKWVYSKKYFEESIITEWNLVCDNIPRRSLFSTLYFIGTYGVLLNGFLSDKFGRKKAAYMFIVANSILNIILSILLSVDPSSIDSNLQQILFGVIRLFCGIASNVYAVAVVLAIEICGSSKRVTAANVIYYFYILGELVVVFFAYFIKNYRHLYMAYTALMTAFVLYFWTVPESPRWLMIKNHTNSAYKVFERIAKSNKKIIENCSELETLKRVKNKRVEGNGIHLNVITPHNTENKRSSFSEDVNEKLEDGEVNIEQPFSVLKTLKIFFKSKKLIIRSLVILVNWLTNTLVYYGISFNTTDLVGDPFLNFFLSVVVEFIAILACQFTLEKFGRKKPYAINMALSGLALLLVQFVPTHLPSLVTVLALIGKFCISFTYNGVYIITAELHPTVIRNSSVSICQAFARIGAIIAPNIQLLGDLYWFPIPFIVYGSFSTLSAVTFVVFMPETKDKKLPDTIEEFVK